MSVEDWVRELEELKGIPILEGELEWISLVIDGKIKTEDEHTHSDDEQEHTDKKSKS